MTPLIDIVFLLIIFFLVVCQFIEAENFSVSVPDNCKFARDDTRHDRQITTVTVMKSPSGAVDFAVGPQKVIASDTTSIVRKVAELIDINLRDLPVDSRIVTLRIDKDIPFSQAQYALEGIAASSAKDIHLAALKNERPQHE
jgi:biopolymer transport protein ExbD